MKSSLRTRRAHRRADVRRRDRALAHARANVRVAGFESFVEYAFGRVPIDQINPHFHQPLSSPTHLCEVHEAHVRHRLRAIGLIVAAPLLALLAIVVKLADGPVLYRQTRMGQDGRPFTIYKLGHALRRGAERRYVLEQGRSADDPNWPRPAPHASGRASSAVERVKGEMSIVGPRPSDRVHRADRGARRRSGTRRFLGKPGMTGWHRFAAAGLRLREWRRSSPSTSGTCGTGACWSTCSLHAHADFAVHRPDSLTGSCLAEPAPSGWGSLRATRSAACAGMPRTRTNDSRPCRGSRTDT